MTTVPIEQCGDTGMGQIVDASAEQLIALFAKASAPAVRMAAGWIA